MKGDMAETLEDGRVSKDAHIIKDGETQIHNAQDEVKPGERILLDWIWQRLYRLPT